MPPSHRPRTCRSPQGHQCLPSCHQGPRPSPEGPRSVQSVASGDAAPSEPGKSLSWHGLPPLAKFGAAAGRGLPRMGRFDFCRGCTADLAARLCDELRRVVGHLGVALRELAAASTKRR